MNHLSSFLGECVVGVLSTCHNDEIHSVPVYYFYRPSEKAFYFISKSKSQKIDLLKKNKSAAFVVYSETLPQTFTAQCRAEIVSLAKNDEQSNEIIKKLAEVHSTREYYPSPLSSMKEGELILVRLEVLDYQYKSYVAGFERTEKSA